MPRGPRRSPRRPGRPRAGRPPSERGERLGAGRRRRRGPRRVAPHERDVARAPRLVRAAGHDGEVVGLLRRGARQAAEPGGRCARVGGLAPAPRDAARHVARDVHREHARRAAGRQRVVAARPVAAAVEGQRLPVGRLVARRVVGQPPRVRAVGVHDVDLLLAVARAREGDLRAVGRQLRALVEAGRVGQPAHVRAVGAHHVDVLLLGLRAGLNVPAGARSKRIRVPSGDHEGAESKSPLLVSWRTFVPSAFMT